MTRIFRNRIPSCAVAWVFFAFTLVGSSVCLAEEKAPSRIAGVDNTNMGAYRALAQLSFQAYQTGDKETAAELARVLECTWDKGEKELRKSSPQVWNWIDESMDRYIKPLIESGERAPEPIVVEAAYNEYLVELKLAE